MKIKTLDPGSKLGPRQYLHNEHIVDRYDRFVDQGRLELRLRGVLGEVSLHICILYVGRVVADASRAGAIITTSWFDDLEENKSGELWKMGGEFGRQLWMGTTGQIDERDLGRWRGGEIEGGYYLRLSEDPVIILNDTRKVLLNRQFTSDEGSAAHRVVLAAEIRRLAEADKLELNWARQQVLLDEAQMEAIRDLANRMEDTRKRATGPYPDENGNWSIWKTNDGETDGESEFDIGGEELWPGQG